MINLNNLYSFYVCAEHLNFSKAAAIIGVTQPSLSLQIKNLERELGAQLFLRNGKSISLTSRGQQLLDSSGLFQDLQDKLENFSESTQTQQARPSLRITVTDEIERPFVAEVAANLNRKEKIPMAIFSAGTEEAMNKAENEETDFLLSHKKISSSWNYLQIEFPVFFVTSRALPHAPTFDKPGDIEKVMNYFGEDLIVPSTSLVLGKEFSAFKRRHHLKQGVLLESNIISCLVRFVASGTGCSFLPLPYIKSSLYEKRIHLIGPRDGYWKHSIYVYANIPHAKLETHPLVKALRNFGSLRA